MVQEDANPTPARLPHEVERTSFQNRSAYNFVEHFSNCPQPAPAKLADFIQCWEREITALLFYPDRVKLLPAFQAAENARHAVSTVSLGP